MDTPTAGATSAEILRLVQRALDEFDVVKLDATVRRAVRVASLLGDTSSAVRLSLELQPSGGQPEANAEMTRRLIADPSLWDAPDGIVQSAMEQWIDERAIADDKISPLSIVEMEYYLKEVARLRGSSTKRIPGETSFDRFIHQHLDRARHHAFTLLCRWERQLTFSATQDDSLAVVRQRVDGLLASSSQDTLEAFNVAFRRLREAVGETSIATVGELLSQAVTSCRRILKNVIDTVEPASPDRPESETGHALTDDAYKNRLVEFIRRNVTSDSFRGALRDDGESLFKRFSSVDAMASKGVHAQLATDEAEFCALHTYLLAGEILLLNETGTSRR